MNNVTAENHSQAAYAYVPEVLQNQVLAAVLPKGWTPGFGTKNADSLQARLAETLTNPTLKTTDSTGLETYSYYVPAEHPLQVINLVITADRDNLLEGSVFVYEMTAEFGAAFQQFETDFSGFEGSLKVFSLSALTKLFYKGLQKTEDDLTDCFEFILSQEPTRPSGGGGGQDGEGPGTTVSTGDGPIGGPSGGTCAVVIEIPCGCNPAHEPGEHCACGTGNDTDEEHHQPYQVIIFVNCDENGQKSNDGFIGKSLNPEDCPQLLSSIGVVPRNLNELPGGEQLTELLEAAVNETCFNQLAIEHILDIPALINCTGGNPALGPDCITSQVVAYLNSLELGGIPGTPLQVQFSESMPQHQLAAFLHAAVAGEGNEHVYAGMGYALTNPIATTPNISLSNYLLYLSIVSRESDNDPFPLFNSFVDIVENSGEHLPEQYLVKLAKNQVAIEVIGELLAEVNYDEKGYVVLQHFLDREEKGLSVDDFNTDEGNSLIDSYEEFYPEDSEDIECCDFLIPSISISSPSLELVNWHNVTFREHAAYLKLKEPDKYNTNSLLSKTRLWSAAEYRTLREPLHFTLEVLGVIPGVGIAPDLVNGVIYTIEGEGVDAAFSYSSAIPILGDFSGASRIIYKTLRMGSVNRTLKWLKKGDVIVFNDPSKYTTFRKYWGFPPNTIGHHVVPKGIVDNPLLQKAAKSSDPATVFHPHHLRNGYPARPAQHIGNHPNYSNRIRDRLNDWNAANPNATPEQASAAISQWQSRLQTQLGLWQGTIDDFIAPAI